MSNKTDDRSDTVLVLIPIWMMLMVVVILPLGDNDDPNSLLTDEQKLEKQKELAKIEREKELKRLEDKKYWDDKINYFLEEKPFPYVHLIGLLLFIATITGYSRRRYHYDFMSRVSNPFFMIPLMFGMIYLLWLTGDFPLTLGVEK